MKTTESLLKPPTHTHTNEAGRGLLRYFLKYFISLQKVTWADRMQRKSTMNVEWKEQATARAGQTDRHPKH